MSNLYAYRSNLIENLVASIEVLCSENGSCTVTEVLRFAQVNSTPDIRQLVVYLATVHEYRVENRRNGHRIFDW